MPCASTVVGAVCLNVGEKEPRELNLIEVCARYWEPARIYASGAKVRPTRTAGFEFSAGAAGQSGSREPKWPTALAGTVTDGSITWTAGAVSNDSCVRAISTAVWTAPTGITLSGQSIVNTNGSQRILAYIQGDTAGEYEVSAMVTFSDTSVEQYILKVTVS